MHAMQENFFLGNNLFYPWVQGPFLHHQCISDYSHHTRQSLGNQKGG